MLLASGTQAVDTTGDVCTWSFEALPANAFVLTYKSTRLGDDFPKRLRFTALSPTRVHNTDLNYDATRIICPAQELSLDRAEVAELRDLAAAPRLASTGNTAPQRDLADAIDRLGEALTGQGDLAGALAQFQDSLKLRLAVARTDDENKLWQRDLSTTLLRLGLVRQALKQNVEALDTYRSSLAIRQNLWSANPTDPNARRDLAIAHERVGDMLNLIGNSHDEALNELRLALKLRSDLTMADRNNAMLSTELIVALYKVGALSDPATAKDLLGKAFALAQIMERQGSLAPEYASLPAFLKAELAKREQASTP
jgi:tetratricopeptide (TPR) repeat protein